MRLQPAPLLPGSESHRDEAMAEHGVEQPLGEYRNDSLAAEEVLTLANWCLLHDTGRQNVRRGLR